MKDFLYYILYEKGPSGQKESLTGTIFAKDLEEAAKKISRIYTSDQLAKQILIFEADK